MTANQNSTRVFAVLVASALAVIGFGSLGIIKFNFGMIANSILLLAAGFFVLIETFLEKEQIGWVIGQAIIGLAAIVIAGSSLFGQDLLGVGTSVGRTMYGLFVILVAATSVKEVFY